MEDTSPELNEGFLLDAGQKRVKMRFLLWYTVVFSVLVLGAIIAFWLIGPATGPDDQQRWLAQMAENSPAGAVRASAFVDPACNISAIEQSLATAGGFSLASVVVDSLFVDEATNRQTAIITLYGPTPPPEYLFSVLQRQLGGPGIPCLQTSNFTGRVCAGHWVPELQCSSCFPGQSSVTVRRDQTTKSIQIKDLVPGDEVAVVNGQSQIVFDTFYTWLHKGTTVTNDYWALYHTASSFPLYISARHLLFANQNTEEEPLWRDVRSVQAHLINVGDYVWIEQVGSDVLKPVRIVQVRQDKLKGMYNLATFQGTLLVDGVAVSNYEGVETSHIRTHNTFLPLRALYSAFPSSLLSFLPRAEADGLHWFLRLRELLINAYGTRFTNSWAVSL